METFGAFLLSICDTISAEIVTQTINIGEWYILYHILTTLFSLLLKGYQSSTLEDKHFYFKLQIIKI